MQITSLTEQLLFTTVRITTSGPDGDSLGTGFMYSREVGTETRLFLVTNKHVVDGATGVVLHFMGGDGNNQPTLGVERPFSFGSGATAFVGHPSEDIDIAVADVGGVANALHQMGQPICWRSVDPSIAATDAVLDQFEPIEPIAFIGYPNGLYDSTSLLPIARRGHSATPLAVDYEGRPTFLIDASVFPGSSGSPVFLMVPASAPDKFGNIVIGGAPKCVFLGVVAAVYQRDVPVLTSDSTGFVYDALDIGIVYKAVTVAETIDHYLTTKG